MPIQDFLSSAQGNRDQGPNHELADRIVAGEFAVEELVEFFRTKPHRDLQKDAVLTLAYVAEQAPELITPYTDLLVDNLGSKINRVVWGSLIALAHITPKIPDEVFQHLPKVIDAMHASTVVARDYGFRILAIIYTSDQHREDVFPLVLEEVHLAPANQLGQYAERIMEVLEAEHRDTLRKVLEERREELSNPHHLKRLEKNLKRL